MEFLKLTENDNLTDVTRSLSTSELLENIAHPAAMVRAFVLLELGSRRAAGGWDKARAALLEDFNRRTVLRGLATVTLFVLGEMMQSGAEQKARAQVVWSLLSNKEQADFAAYSREIVAEYTELQAA